MAKIARALGFDLMPWQRYVNDVALEIDPATGLLVYRTVVVTVPRQSGKTKDELAVAVHRALGFGGGQTITYTAQTRVKARQKWEDDHLATLEKSPLRPLFRPRKTTGMEAVLWQNGSSYGIEASTEQSGHGDTLDLGFIDEAWTRTDSRAEQAMKPAMLTRPEPQLWIVSTAGTSASVYLRGHVDRGRERCEAGENRDVAYFEWSAPDDADAADPATWQMCMPALGNTVTEAAVRADFESMDRAEFARAYLNQWPDAARFGWAVIPRGWWEAAAMTDRVRPDRPVFAVDTTPDRGKTSIGLAGARPDGKSGIELADCRAGTSWVVPRAAELDRNWQPRGWVVDPRAAAGSLIADLEAAGLNVIIPAAADIAYAFGEFYDAVRDGRLVHASEPQLASALAGAATRRLGDGLAWDRQSRSVDISPLVAVTLAHWGHLRQAEEGDYDARRSVHFDTAELVRLVKSGVYGPADVERIHARGLLGDADLADLDRAGIPLPAGVRGG